jgi:hypothetical protein
MQRLGLPRLHFNLNVVSFSVLIRYKNNKKKLKEIQCENYSADDNSMSALQPK